MAVIAGLPCRLKVADRRRLSVAVNGRRSSRLDRIILRQITNSEMTAKELLAAEQRMRAEMFSVVINLPGIGNPPARGATSRFQCPSVPVCPLDDLEVLM
jgi:hypothetical protein